MQILAELKKRKVSHLKQRMRSTVINGLHLYIALPRTSRYLKVHHNGLSFTHSLKTHTPTGRCWHAELYQTHWEQLSVLTLAQRHFKHIDSWSQELNHQPFHYQFAAHSCPTSAGGPAVCLVNLPFRLPTAN